MRSMTAISIEKVEQHTSDLISSLIINVKFLNIRAPGSLVNSPSLFENNKTFLNVAGKKSKVKICT